MFVKQEGHSFWPVETFIKEQQQFSRHQVWVMSIHDLVADQVIDLGQMRVDGCENTKFFKEYDGQKLADKSYKLTKFTVVVTV